MAAKDTSGRSQRHWICHLLRRAGFGATPEEKEHYVRLGYDRTLAELLSPSGVDNSRLESIIAAQNFDYTRMDDVRRWWLLRMLYSRRPLEEKMTLFWHGHFATSVRKVKHAYAMYLQNQLFRASALGDFHQLLARVSRDLAMIVWLDSQQNRKGKPNENYAREVMELFTVGIGNYGENDIKEAARAFTGWQVGPGGFFFNARQHDFGEKVVLGARGNLGGDDVLALLAGSPATARLLALKLARFFVADGPDPALVEAAAAAYMSGSYQIRPMLEAIFTHRSFFTDSAYHARIKSPAELVVGTLKMLQVESLDGDLPAIMARMGQNLFEPPSVKGWDSGPAWISTDTMMERFNFAARLTGEKFDELAACASASELAARERLTNARQLVDYFLELLVDGDVPAGTRRRLIAYVSSDVSGTPVRSLSDDTILDTKLRGLVRLIMSLPTYQLA